MELPTFAEVEAQLAIESNPDRVLIYAVTGGGRSVCLEVGKVLEELRQRLESHSPTSADEK
jgi:hypothetical protein